MRLHNMVPMNLTPKFISVSLAVLGLARDQLSPKLRETAYALAVEVAAADLAVG